MKSRKKRSKRTFLYIIRRIKRFDHLREFLYKYIIEREYVWYGVCIIPQSSQSGSLVTQSVRPYPQFFHC